MKTADFFNALKSQNLTHVEKDSGVSRQALHSALKSHNMKLDNLSRVAKAINLKLEFVPVRTEDNLLASLAKWGAPLAHLKDGSLSFEETVGESLKESRYDGVYETLVPYLMTLNLEKLNVHKLVATALFAEQVNVMGYFAELANRFHPHEKLQSLIKMLQPAKSSSNEFLVLTTKSNFPELFEKNKLAQKWNLKVRGSVDDHLLRWRKWKTSQKAS
jgi:hypothetical protein